MKLHDLSPAAQHILRTVYFSGSGLRRSDLVESTGLALEQLSPHLSRLKAKGWVVNEVSAGGSLGSLWTLTETGQALVAEGVAAEPIPEAPEGLEPIPEEPKDLEPIPEAPAMEPIPAVAEVVVADAVAEQLLTAMEVEVALDRLRHSLRAGRLPARTARVYAPVKACR